MNPVGLLRGALAGAVAYGVALVIALQPARAFDPLEENAALGVAVLLGYLVGALVGGYVGTWQARAGRVRAPALGLIAAVVPIALIGTALVAGEGTEGVNDALFYGVNPLGAVVGATAYLRRWLAATE